MIRRFYENIIQNHMNKYEQMIFISGARQVGKTTLAKQFQTSDKSYLNWDNVVHREIILSRLFDYIDNDLLAVLSETKPCLILDEIHKYENWKNFIKGIYDQYKGRIHLIITGSAKLDIYSKGGDSLMGRYFNYQIMPLSVHELLEVPYAKKFVNQPSALAHEKWGRLFRFGGYPEAYSKNDIEFFELWSAMRWNQLFKEEIRDYANVHDIAQLELMGKLIIGQVGSLINYAQVAKKIQKSESTVRSWFQLLESTYYLFSISPWSNNVNRSILKAPKAYLHDWSLVNDVGARIENYCAVHLLKAIYYWKNTGQGHFSLHYLRDKDQREVDFLIAKEDQPWMLIEVKKSLNISTSKNLLYFQRQLNPTYTFQLVFDAEFIKLDLFNIHDSKIVPMHTFLSQLF
ncbi:ATP-binding protein [Caedibacter taeniospiralis]|uniref:ATP-binding protein n=1 Tax=Caedibacter taeniospiralis TaxID=28907 RepID=UPI000C273C38|nr:ATP-binding protein [Caedibacter taeniospiralis]